MPVYKNEKAGTWLCKFYYTDWTGTRKQKKKEGFRTKKEAQEFEREFLSKAHASFLIEKGFSPLLIADRSGHENIETTLQTYSHLYPNKHSEVADLIEEVHSQAPKSA